ncbi:MAG: type II secretion system F family protein [Alphaproteobacteria bacterium]|jgi:Flp pilus assembly protein TadC|nr:type II secretion system F family protein [Alphaproteobacteria bacterium]MBU0792395.1 type II secretion system F family protein [Alphaproteobacteria bacterium]MBU0877160.1 type II secretion system F family protein [Alphaproteobacteria bacterium]MBU1770734.1 type II secretion system F family protein [Alphaproteobacteria bacterium]
MVDVLISSELVRITALAGLFIIVVLAVLLVARLLAGRSAIRSRLAETATGQALGSVARTHLREQERNEGWSKLTAAIERAGIPLTDEKNSSLKEKLALAGFDTASAARIFTLVRLFLLFGVPAIYLAFALSGSERPSLITIYFVSVILALIGMYAPNLWLRLRVDRRKQEIINGFPDCLDLMLVCVEAGLGMEAAFDRVGREVLRSHPRLAELLSAATLELRAGASREQALRGMAQRAKVDEIRAFTTLLIQSDKLGTSIGQTLRVYANEMREKRRLRAEEKAHRLPVLLSIPLVACMLPTMIGVLMLPAAIRVVKILIPIMVGGN